MQSESKPDMIVLREVWKIFGDKADAAMIAIQEQNLSKQEVLSKFD